MADDEATGETKVEPKQEGVIELIVKDQNGTEVHFKVKRHTRLEKVIKAYCDKKGLDVSSVRFLYDGVRIQPSSTPGELEMEDEDTIDCLVEQVGGSA